MYIRLFFLSFFLLISTFPALAETALIVDGSRANIRTGSGETFQVISSISPGTAVEIIGHEQNGFRHIRTLNGQVGWIKSTLLQMQNTRVPALSSENTNTHVTPQTSTVSVPPAQSAATNEAMSPAAASTKLPTATANIAACDEQSFTATVYVLFGIGIFLAGCLTGGVVVNANYKRKLHGIPL